MAPAAALQSKLVHLYCFDFDMPACDGRQSGSILLECSYQYLRRGDAVAGSSADSRSSSKVPRAILQQIPITHRHTKSQRFVEDFRGQ